MRCSDARRKLSALLDGAEDRDLSGALAAHVDGCAGCRAELDALAGVDRALRDVLDAEPPPAELLDGFEERVRARIAADAARPELEDLRTLAAHALERAAGHSAPEVPAGLLGAPAALGQVVLPVPDAAPRRRWPVLVVAATAAGGLIALALVLKTRGEPPIVAADTPRREAPAATAAPPPPPPPRVAAAPAPAPEEAPRKIAPREARPVEKAAEPAPAAEPPPPSQPLPSPNKSAGELLGGVTGSAPAGGAPSAPGATTPGIEKLTFEQIKTGMMGMQDRVQACYERYKVAGSVIVKIKIDPDGHVVSAERDGGLAGDPAGCVVHAVHDATFARYDGLPMVIRYAFKLQEIE